VEVDVWAGDVLGRAAVPSAPRPARREALELRDGDKSRYLGKGVRTAVAHVNGEIATALRRAPLDQRAVDEAMIALDGTPPRAGWAPMPCWACRWRRAGRRARGSQPALRPSRHPGGTRGDTPFSLPVPMMNILNGGAHADSSVDLQEFMVMPSGCRPSRMRSRAGAEIFHALRGILKKAGHSTGVGDEGGFAPSLKSNQEALDVVLERHRQGGLRRRQGRLPGARRGLERAVGQRPLRVQEVGRADAHAGRDGRDVRGWVRNTRSSRSRTVWPRTTGPAGRPSRRRWATACSWWATTCSSPTPRSSKRGIAEGVGNSILVKLNQIGTVSETLDADRDGARGRLHHGDLAPLGRDRRLDIADLAVGTSAGQIKTGRPAAATASPSTTSCCASRKSSGAGALRRPARLRQLAARTESGRLDRTLRRTRGSTAHDSTGTASPR
jgi:enolase